MRRFTCPIFSLLACAALSYLIAAPPEAGQKPRVLYITATAGFHHSACEYSVPIIEKIARESGAFEVVSSSKTDLITREGQATATGIYLFAVRDEATGRVERGKFLILKSDREGF